MQSNTTRGWVYIVLSLLPFSVILLGLYIFLYQRFSILFYYYHIDLPFLLILIICGGITLFLSRYFFIGINLIRYLDRTDSIQKVEEVTKSQKIGKVLILSNLIVLPLTLYFFYSLLPGTEFGALILLPLALMTAVAYFIVTLDILFFSYSAKIGARKFFPGLVALALLSICFSAVTIQHKVSEAKEYGQKLSYEPAESLDDILVNQKSTNYTNGNDKLRQKGADESTIYNTLSAMKIGENRKSDLDKIALIKGGSGDFVYSYINNSNISVVSSNALEKRLKDIKTYLTDEDRQGDHGYLDNKSFYDTIMCPSNGQGCDIDAFDAAGIDSNTLEAVYEGRRTLFGMDILKQVEVSCGDGLSKYEFAGHPEGIASPTSYVSTIYLIGDVVVYKFLNGNRIVYESDKVKFNLPYTEDEYVTICGKTYLGEEYDFLTSDSLDSVDNFGRGYVSSYVPTSKIHNYKQQFIDYMNQ